MEQVRYWSVVRVRAPQISRSHSGPVSPLLLSTALREQGGRSELGTPTSTLQAHIQPIHDYMMTGPFIPTLHMLPLISSVTKVHCSGNAREHFDPIYESLFLKHSVDVKQKTCPWHILPCRQRQPWCRGGWCWEGAGSQITVGRWKTRRSGQREEAIRSCNVVTVLPEPGLAMADGPLQHQSGVVTGSHIKHLICPAPPRPHNPAHHSEKRSIGWNILKWSGKWIQIKCLLVFFLILHNILEYIP